MLPPDVDYWLYQLVSWCLIVIDSGIPRNFVRGTPVGRDGL